MMVKKKMTILGLLIFVGGIVLNPKSSEIKQQNKVTRGIRKTRREVSSLGLRRVREGSLFPKVIRQTWNSEDDIFSIRVDKNGTLYFEKTWYIRWFCDLTGGYAGKSNLATISLIDRGLSDPLGETELTYTHHDKPTITYSLKGSHVIGFVHHSITLYFVVTNQFKNAMVTKGLETHYTVQDEHWKDFDLMGYGDMLGTGELLGFISFITVEEAQELGFSL